MPKDGLLTIFNKAKGPNTYFGLSNLNLIKNLMRWIKFASGFGFNDQKSIVNDTEFQSQKSRTFRTRI